MGGMGHTMKNRGSEPRSYSGGLMRVGGPGEEYIACYLETEYARVERVGALRQRRDFRCFLPDGTIHLNEGKTDTRIAETRRVPWEVFRLEGEGQRAYLSWGYGSPVYRVIYFVPQWLRLLDVQAEHVRRLIFDHIKNGGRTTPIFPTVTDNDRITANFLVPLGLLKQHGYLREVDIAESPLVTGSDQQPRLDLHEVRRR